MNRRNRRSGNKGSLQSRGTLWTRRDLVTRSAWFMILSSLAVTVVGAVRLLFPRVQFTPPTTVVLGRPEDFSVGEVSERWKQSHKLILVRDEEGFYALSSVCTHLGCIPHWRPSQQILRCPCHGSGFHRTGINFEGPAPRPLERLAISLDSAGRIVVDTAIRLREEEGDWLSEQAFLSYSDEARNESS